MQYLLTSLSFHHCWHSALWLSPGTVCDGNLNSTATICVRHTVPCEMMKWMEPNERKPALRERKKEKFRAVKNVTANLPCFCFSSFTFSYFLTKNVRSRLASMPRGDRSYSKCYLIKGSPKG